MIRARSLLDTAAIPPTTMARPGLGPPMAGLQSAKDAKDKVASRYDEAIGYAMPGRDGLLAGPDQSEIYDDTAPLAAPEFASRIQQGVMPNFTRWASFLAGVLIQDPDEKLALEKALEPIDKYLFEMINSSNFSVEASEAFLDLGLGTAGFRIDEAAGTNPFNCRAIPLRGLSFGIGPDGRPDPIYETREVQIQDIAVIWPHASLPGDLAAAQDPCAKVKVVDAWHRDWSRASENRYRNCVFIEGRIDTMMEEYVDGDGCCPVIVFRWSKASGEAWGRGPLFNILPSMRLANYAIRALLDHTDIQLGGIWQAEDDGVVNVDTVKLDPGTIVPIAPGSKGLTNVVPNGNFDMAQFNLQEARTNIRKALYTEQLGNPNKTPASATEIQARMAELARAIGSPFVRTILEFTMPSIGRFTRILRDRKLIVMPHVNGKEIKLVPTGPLAQGQRFDDIDSMTHFVGSLIQTLGPEMTNVIVDGGEYARELGDRYQVPKTIIRSKVDQETIIGRIQQGVTSANGADQGAQPAADGGAGPGA